MEFILLFFINIITGTVFYLIIRMKLLRNASDYREKRLKREMDEIICEFNETAERNITILENRIEYLKKLLENSGTIKKVDFSIDDDKEINTYSTKAANNNSATINNSIIVADNRITEKKMNGLISKYFSQIKGKLNKVFSTGIKDTQNEYSNRLNGHSYNANKYFNIEDEIPVDSLEETNLIQQKSGISIIKNEDTYNQELNRDTELSELDIEKMFSISEDKYLLIPELFEKGYSAEIISRCSGIPIGEIKLILDLNTSLL